MSRHGDRTSTDGGRRGTRIRRRLTVLSAVCGMAVLAAVSFLALSAGGAQADAPEKAGSTEQGGPVVSWSEDGSVQSAWVALDELAMVSERGVDRIRITPLAPPARGLDDLRARLRAGADDGSAAVLYQGERSEQTRLVSVGELIVRFRSGLGTQARAAVVRRLGLTRVRRFAFSARTYLYRAAAPLDELRVIARLSASSLVEWAAPSFLRTRARRWMPNDPLFGQQWHLRNVGQRSGRAGEDIDVTTVWDQTVDGVPLRGSPDEVIAIADDGLEIGHPDLAPNVVSGRSWDWADGDADPSPSRSSSAAQWHGTACAGVAAARGGNGLGVSGAAPSAGLIGYRFLIDGVDSDAVEAEALAAVRPDAGNRDIVDVSSNSWGPLDDRHLEAPGPLTEAALRDGVTNGRGGLGIVYVWAAGNGRAELDNVNYDGFANSRYTLAVGASTNLGRIAPYSEDGAALMVVAPSSDGVPGTLRDVLTTDLTGSAGYTSGDYYSGFGGTSSAAPLVSGVAALLLQADPALTWRDVQAVLMTTAQKIDPRHKGWSKNAAGYHISHTYGFGRVDAAAAVAAARSWRPLGPETIVTASASPQRTIPDASTVGVTSAIGLGAGHPRLTTEYVEVVLDAPHEYWHDLEVTLIAPSGTRSILSPSALPDSVDGSPGFSRWRFGSARHFGESSTGTWRLRVRDLRRGDRGRFVRWTLRVYGTVAGPDTEPPRTRVSPSRRWWNRPVKLRLVATDVGSNVARTELRVGSSSTGAFRRSTRVEVAAARRSHARDGRRYVWFRSYDNSGNVEKLRRFTVNIDTRRPTTRVLSGTRVRRGRTAKVRFAVSDPGFSARRARVRLQVRDRRGKVVATYDAGRRKTNRRDTFRFRCTLRRGTYTVRVLARDLAGNAQRRAQSAVFVVR